MITARARWVAWNMLDGNLMAGDVLREGRELTVLRVDGTTCRVPADQVRDATADEIKSAKRLHCVGPTECADQMPDMTTLDGYQNALATARDHARQSGRMLYLFCHRGVWHLVPSTEDIPMECDIRAVPPRAATVERAWPGSAAYEEPAATTGLSAVTRLKLQTAITEHDRRQSRGRRYNPNALGLMLDALQDVERDVESGASLARALYDHFQDTLLAALERSVGLPLTYGGGPKSTGRPD